MKTRQPSPACAGTAFNIVISLADQIRCGLSAALAAEIGWTRRLDATWTGYIVRLLPFCPYFGSARGRQIICIDVQPLHDRTRVNLKSGQSLGVKRKATRSVTMLLF